MYLESCKSKTKYNIHNLDILQLMAKFLLENMKARWNIVFKVVKEKKTVKAEFYIQQKYYSRIKAK